MIDFEFAQCVRKFFVGALQVPWLSSSLDARLEPVVQIIKHSKFDHRTLKSDNIMLFSELPFEAINFIVMVPNDLLMCR